MNESIMPNTLSRCVRIDNWVFEIKSIRALKVEQFGKPYSAIASFTLNGDVGYIDGLLTGQEEEFTKEDHQAFYKLSQQLNLTEVNFDRFKRQRRVSNSIKIRPLEANRPKLKLVKA